MLPRSPRPVIIACSLVLFSSATAAPQTRLKARVQTPGNDPLVAREQVTIDGAGKYTTDDSGEFEFDLVQGLKIGQPARFHVTHVNSKIRIQQWIVVRPCDLLNGRKDSLPDAGPEPLVIVVLSKGDQRLKSLSKDYSVLGCIIEEGVSEFAPTSRSGGPDRSSLFYGGTSVVADGVLSRPRRGSLESASFPSVVHVAYRAPLQEKSSDSSLPDAAVLGETFLAKRAAELGFATADLVDALKAWARSLEDGICRA